MLSLIDLWVQKDIAILIHDGNLSFFFLLFVLVLVSLLSLIRCLVGMGSSGLGK